MQSPTSFNPFDGGLGASRGGGFKATSGAMGIAALFTALLGSNASGSFKIVAYGLLLELARRAITWLYARFAIEPKVSATFTQGDPAYEWIMLFLTEEGVWKKSKDFDVSVKSSKRKFAVAPIYDEQGIQFSADLVPKWSMPHLFRWNKYWIDVTRGVDGTTANPWSGNQASPTLTLRFLTLDPVIIARFVEFCKKRYEETNRPRVTVHLSDTPMGRNVWSNTKSKVRRPINTVTLPSGVMDSILEDVREFMDIEDWYITAGIPHHRGYLLHGPPGTGKTSTIYAVAGELGLEIYALSLSASHIDDAYLHRLAAAVPRGSILLIEDIDCAFPSRDAEDDEDAAPPIMQQVMQATATGGRNAMMPAATGRVTMSGLLNLMDGVGSDDGRIIFATTNYYDRLDPALIRPGRMDVKVQYFRATTEQAGALFDRFFPSERFISPHAPSTLPEKSSTTSTSTTTSTKGNKRLRTTPLSRPLPELSKAFATGIPSDEFSAAEIQGFLLTCKWDPEAAVTGLEQWIVQQRVERKERAEREVQDREKRKAKREAAEDKAAERIFSRVGGRRGGKAGEE